MFILLSAVTKKETNKNPARFIETTVGHKKEFVNQDNAGYILSACS